MDTFSAERRSEIMSSIRSTGTAPELLFGQLARRIAAQELGSRVKVIFNARQFDGSPDIAIPSIRLALFMDGCFFHRCPKHGRSPKSNPAYWEKKIQGNVARDKRISRALRRRGFSVWRFWEHDLRSHRMAACERRIRTAVQHAVRRIEIESLD